MKGNSLSSPFSEKKKVKPTVSKYVYLYGRPTEFNK